MNMPEKIDVLCNEIEREISANPDNLSGRLRKMSQGLCNLVKEESDSVKESVTDKIREIAVHTENMVLKIWLYSVIMKFTKNIRIAEEFIKYIIQEDRFRPETKYFLYYQIETVTFSKAHFDNENIKYLKWKLLENIVAAFKEELKEYLDYIPYSERNMDMAIVICGQILSVNHAPTIIAADKCKFLAENMHKKVLLVNTAETLTNTGCLPYYDAVKGIYIDDLLYKDFIEWKGTRIPFFQCEDNMPNMNDLSALLQMIRKVKPGLIMAIGTSGIFANLADNIIPVLTYGTIGDIKSTMTRCQTLSRKLESNDIRLLKRVGIDKDSIIEILPKVSINEQKFVVTRKELGLPEDKFIIAVIGNRLDAEVDEKFMRMLASALDTEMAVAIIGIFTLYENYLIKNPELQGKVFYLGKSEDVQAWLEVCDLYVNPYRVGGGTTSVCALVKGVPVVTLEFGDVAVCVGKEFYNKMSEQARIKADSLIDSKEDFQMIVEEFQKRIKE